tara:strand:- start:1698 stop:1973 length:276 start_codon:yes stop_codon:yes gene_type:complete
MTQPTQTVVVGQKKSVGVALILSILFGPLGLLYASAAGGLILILVGIGLSILTLGMLAIPLAIIAWIVSVPWAVIAVSSHNSKIVSASRPY